MRDNAGAPPSTIRLEVLSPDTYDDFASLFTEDGSGCYCAAWRSMDSTWSSRCKDSSKPNRALTRTHVEAGGHVGFLAFDGDALVGWVGGGPKTAFPSMERERFGARLSPFVSEAWVIGCLAWEGAGNRELGFRALVAAFIESAREARASVVEAFPVRPGDPSRTYRGSEELYSSLGFEVAGSEHDGTADILLVRLVSPAAPKCALRQTTGLG
jgi:hypothetical protein